MNEMQSIPVLGNVVHRVGNTCLGLEASWQGSSRAVKLGRYGFHSNKSELGLEYGGEYEPWKGQYCKIGIGM